MKLRQTAAHVVLTLLLLLSQQLGVAHAVSHLSSEVASGASHQKQLPPELQCDQCLAFAAIGSALNTPPHSFIFAPALSLFDAAPPVFRLLPAATRAFDSRAPPVVIS